MTANLGDENGQRSRERTKSDYIAKKILQIEKERIFPPGKEELESITLMPLELKSTIFEEHKETVLMALRGLFAQIATGRHLEEQDE